MFDFHGSGMLNYRELALLLSALLPLMPRLELRKALKHFYLTDWDNTGKISHEQLLRTIGFVVSRSLEAAPPALAHP